MKRRRWIGRIVLGLMIVGSAWFVWLIRPVLAPFLLAVAIAYVVAPLVNFLVRRGWGRGLAILTVYVGLLLLVGAGIWKGLPSAARELHRLADAIPVYGAALREMTADLQWQVERSGAPAEMREAVDKAIAGVEAWSAGAVAAVLGPGSLQRLIEVFFAVLLAPVLAFYLLKDMDYFKERLIRAVPKRWRNDIVMLLRNLDLVVAGFVRGQVLLALIVGALATVATYLLGLRYALLLGLFAGLTELIPYIGPVLGAIPAVLVGLSVSPMTALQVALVFALIQQLENAVLSPKVMGERIGLHPLAVLLVVLAGGYLVGPWGLILSLPVAGMAKVLWQFVVVRLTAPSSGPDPTS